MTERRQNPRVTTVLEATWHGQSGNAPCRVTDLSARGCFVETVYAPPIGDDTDVTLTIRDARVRFRGQVRYVEARLGFGVALDVQSDEQRDALARGAGLSAPVLVGA
jgi:PilZ domain-containing protein